MPKPQPFTPKPALEKLPLAVRKDLRDNFEAEKEDWETQISDLLGAPFKINFNANEVWAYASDGSSAGSIFANYAKGFIDALKYFLDKFGDIGKEYFNQTVTQSELSLGVNTLGEKAPVISAEIKDGVFRILFRSDCLGYNTSSIYETIVPAIEGVPREGFSLQAKHSIEENYNSEIEELQKEIGEILAMPDVILDPNFEENYQALVKGKKDQDWQRNFGATHFAYFKDGLKWQLEYQKFKGDEMLQEGLAETLTSKTFKIRVVDKLNKGYCNEVVLENGVMYLQSTPDKWYYNTSDMGSGLVDLL